jgi:hypothetical protein
LSALAAVVGGATVVAVAVSPTGVTPVYCSAPGMPRCGVGSKGTHPIPANHTSGQAWALRPRTRYVSGPVCSPGVKPTATRAGRPSARASAA